jgi:16S rRNA (adenine1518-N6/adenine1519-N6)-dimethyltransferase
MKQVKAKKHLGQHFLKDLGIAHDIADALTGHGGYKDVLEIGPGMGVLTQFLIKKDYNLTVIEIDRESVDYLKVHFPGLKIISGDFLRIDLSEKIETPYAVAGNFPYNISSQIFFSVLENKNLIPEVVGMVQKEVGMRIASGPGNKDYGILSVLLQAFYNIEYLFTVDEHVFNPPPRVKSGVIRLKRNERKELPCEEKLFFTVVKQSFQTRRKTLRNALKSLNLPVDFTSGKLFDLRAEQLSVQDFIELTLQIEELRKHGV